MRKLATKVAIVAAFAAVAGYGVYNSQKLEVTLSDTMLANVEALARQELPSESRCMGSWNKECCVCGNKHYTYAKPVPNQVGCIHRTGCSHF